MKLFNGMKKTHEKADEIFMGCNIKDDDHMNDEEVQELLSGDVVLFALSTCMWCKKTLKMLDENDIRYSKIFVDQLDLDQKRMVRDELRKYNDRMSYPTIKFGDKTLVGFDRKKLEEAIDSWK